jgi:hypothetical protein
VFWKKGWKLLKIKDWSTKKRQRETKRRQAFEITRAPGIGAGEMEDIGFR